MAPLVCNLAELVGIEELVVADSEEPVVIDIEEPVVADIEEILVVVGDMTVVDNMVLVVVVDMV